MTASTRATEVNAYLEEFRALLEGTDLVHEPVRGWLLSGLELHRLGVRLDRALGLAAPGKPTSATILRRARRNVALREALALVGTVQALAAAVSRFEAGKWRRWRDRTLPPEQATELDRALFQAFRHGPVPKSPKQLRRKTAGT